MNRGDEAVGPPEHLHPGYLLSGLFGTLRGVGGAYAVLAYLAISGRAAFALAGIVVLLAVMSVGVFISWRRFEYRVGADEIRIDSGVLSRTHRSIPFDRIQDVDITQGPLARVLGIAKVTFETGGGSALPGKEEGVLRAITLQRAEELRRLVRAHRSGSAVAPAVTAAVAEEEETRPVYAMSIPRLLLTGTFNFSLALFAGLLGLSQTVGDVLNIDPFSRSFWNRVLSASGPFRDYVLAHQLVTALAGMIVLVLAGLLTGIVRTVLRDYGFRLDKTAVGLRRRRGLFTRTDVTLPAKRAQAAIARSGPLRERFGFNELRVQNLAQDEDKSGTHVLAPLAKGEEMAHILSELGWRPLPASLEWQRVSRCYFWKSLILVAPLLIPAIAASFAMNPLVGLAWLIVPATFALLRYLDWKRIGYSLDGDRLLMRSGWWRRRITILPLAKIQSIDLKHNFVTRWFGTASLQFGVAGGNALVAHSIPDIPSGRASDLRERLLSSAP